MIKLHFKSAKFAFICILRVQNILSLHQQINQNLRETFFLNQMRVNNHIVSSAATDFMIDNRYFEIGGRSKGNRQIQNLEKAYVVKDDIELSSDNILPLWWFGLNY